MASKLGIHALVCGDTDKWAARCRPPVLKLCDPQGDRETLAAWRQASPGSLIMIRVSGEPENTATEHLETLSRGECRARAVTLMEKLDRILGDLVGQADIIEVVNEPDPPGAEGYRRLAWLLLACIEWADAHWPGRVLAMPALNNGTPEPAELQAMFDEGLFHEMLKRGHIWTVHEGVNMGTPLMPLQEAAPWLALRYRKTQAFLRERGLTGLRYIISEAYLGGGFSANNVADVVARARWYDDELAKDPDVIAFLPFTCGTRLAWQDQSYDQLYAAPGGLVDYAVSRLTEKEQPMSETNGSADVVLLHHVFANTDLAALTAGAPGQFRLTFAGQVQLEKIAGGAAPAGPQWRLGLDAGGRPTIAAPAGVEFKVYEAPQPRARSNGAFSDGRIMSVLEITPDGWLCVFRSRPANRTPVEMWLPPFCISTLA